MRWPWQKKKTRRLPSILSSLERTAWKLQELADFEPFQKVRLIEERDEAQKQLLMAKDQQRRLANEAENLRYSACSRCGEMWFPFAPHEQSKSDPDFDAAMAAARREDEERKK